MIRPQEITQLNGFGQGNFPGKYFFSSGFKRTANGVAPAWTIEEQDVAPANTLGLMNWITQSGTGIVGVAPNGSIYRSFNPFYEWSLDRTVSTSHGNGLICDQQDRLLIARDTKLDKYVLGGAYTSNWKDFGYTTSNFRPMELLEDMVLIGNGNTVAVLFSDDSFNTNVFSLPTNFVIRCIKAGKNGVLIGANFQNRGYLILWDGYSTRSIAPWIPCPTTISSIAIDENGGWIITTANGTFKTNGYVIAPYAELPNNKTTTGIFSNVLPGGTLYHQNRFFLSFNPATDYTPLAKMPVGIMIHDDKSGLWEFVETSTKHRIKAEMGAIFLDSYLNINISYDTVAPTSAAYMGLLKEDFASKATLISEELGVGNNWKYAEALTGTIRFSPNQSIRYATQNWTITAKIYDFKRQLYGYGLTNGTSAALNQVKNDGSNASQKGAQIGDEVTILNGSNAGEIRHITAITNEGLSNEVWILDSNLPNLTESGVYMQVMPFKTIGSKTLSGTQDYFFNIKNRNKGKRFLIKFILETTDSATMLPELAGQTFIYDDNPLQ